LVIVSFVFWPLYRLSFGHCNICCLASVSFVFWFLRNTAVEETIKWGYIPESY
jgi:uncharacterized membrane protein YqjE